MTDKVLEPRRLPVAIGVAIAAFIGVPLHAQDKRPSTAEGRVFVTRGTPKITVQELNPLRKRVAVAVKAVYSSIQYKF